jgi:chloramphenicol-sensitive protein RarD
MAESDKRRTRTGVAYGLAAFTWWGCHVFYFKAVAHVASLEVLAHRIVWSTLLLVALLAARGRLRAAVASMKNARKLAAISVSTCLIAFNWFVFIWAVTHDRVLETSMGYFINPLVNVLLGFVFLRERFRLVQTFAILLATIAVTILWVHHGRVPAIALALAFSFALYGLIRKVVRVEGVVGLAAECLILTPVALGYLFYLERTGALAFTHVDRPTDGLLVAAGVITAVPLVWFVNAALRLRYATVGLMQYIGPTLVFIFAVFVFHEPFGGVQLVSFILIWTALALYTIGSIRDASRAALE